MSSLQPCFRTLLEYPTTGALGRAGAHGVHGKRQPVHDLHGILPFPAGGGEDGSEGCRGQKARRSGARRPQAQESLLKRFWAAAGTPLSILISRY